MNTEDNEMPAKAANKKAPKKHKPAPKKPARAPAKKPNTKKAAIKEPTPRRKPQKKDNNVIELKSRLGRPVSQESPSDNGKQQIRVYLTPPDFNWLNRRYPKAKRPTDLIESMLKEIKGKKTTDAVAEDLEAFCKFIAERGDEKATSYFNKLLKLFKKQQNIS